MQSESVDRSRLRVEEGQISPHALDSALSFSFLVHHAADDEEVGVSPGTSFHTYIVASQFKSAPSYRISRPCEAFRCRGHALFQHAFHSPTCSVLQLQYRVYAKY